MFEKFVLLQIFLWQKTILYELLFIANLSLLFTTNIILVDYLLKEVNNYLQQDGERPPILRPYVFA